MNNRLSPPFFSVVIPTYNRKDFLVVALKSVLAQTFQDFEVIVVDDGSTDGTNTEIQDFCADSRVRYIHTSNWGGPARPRNLGIAASKGHWVAFLDADDYWTGNKLEETAKVSENADVISHHLQGYGPQGSHNQFYRSRAVSRSTPGRDLIVNGNKLLCSATSVRRSFLSENNQLFLEDRAIIACEDYDLWIRLGLKAARFTLIDKSLGYYYRGSGNISASGLTMTRKYDIVVRSYFQFLDSDAQQLALKNIAYFEHCSLFNANNFTGSISAGIKSLTTRHPRRLIFALARITLAVWKYIAGSARGKSI